MRRSALVVVVLLFALVLFGINNYDVQFEQKNGELELNFDVNDFEINKVEVDGVSFSNIVFDGKVHTKDKGFAKLPFIHASLEISHDKNYDLNISDSDYTEIQLDYPLLPSRGVIYRNQDPATIPYEIADESVSDNWYPGNITKTTDPYIFRNIRGMNVYVYSFQYNAEKLILRVYNKVNVKLVQNNTTPINKLFQTNKIAPQMNNIYRSLFINYEQNRDWSNSIGEMGEMLVIYTSRDASVIQPYITWKREMGYTVHTQQVSTGTNVKTTIQNAYNSNSNLLYVQLVGDWADIKSDLGTTQNAPMDPKLGCVSGSDNYPELIIGRFSASSTSQVTVQINKAIEYEKNPSGTWYSKGLGIGSPDGSGNGDDGEIDYVHMDIIKENKLMPFTYTSVTEAYQYPSDSSVATAINNGLSVINYCGHGSETSFVTSGFNNADIANLSNGDMLPFIFSVACVNGKFHQTSGDCFAETWLEKSNGGAVAVIMSTINQPWQPPMRGQDYMNDLLTGGYSYSSNPGSGTNTTEGKTTFGSITFNSFVLMYAESNASDDLETIQTWTIFGDASLQVRTATPAAISVSNTTVSGSTPYSTTITKGGSAVEGALVSLYQSGNTYSGITNSSGNVTISHSISSGTVKLTVSGFNLDTTYQDVTVSGGSTPAEISVNPTSFSKSLDIDGSTTANMTISNYGETNLTYTATINYSGTRDDRAYCAASGGNDEYISRVQVGSIDNTSTAGNYVDYTSQSTDMTIGTGYPITITNGNPYSSDQCGIWVDWNQDDDFSDANESISISNNPGNGPYTATITPPAGAVPGSTRMRVRITYTGAVDPCGTTQYGEVEDYTINIGGSGSPMNWLTLNSGSSVNGTISQGNNNSITVGFDATGLDANTYNATISITNNDPDENPTNIPVTLVVSSGSTSPSFVLSPSSLSFGNVQVGNSSTLQFTISNS
ncbi:MAG: hypothetical protein K8S23_05380, partial [Candidatus Cloacimonetes bacterium]|nr:hypothetical protein [Candidatus Cloacimonadota bacterium]